jgi:hypothetical protein
MPMPGTRGMPRRRRPKIQPQSGVSSGCNGGCATQMGQRRRADPTLHTRARCRAVAVVASDPAVVDNSYANRLGFSPCQSSSGA